MKKDGSNHVVLSIDVGVRNMACCKAAVGPCGGVVEILEWTVLDLTRSGGDAGDAAEAAVTCVHCAGRKRPFQAAFVHAAHPPLCGPHARKIQGMFFPLPVISAAARKRKRRADAEAQAAAFLDDGIAEEEEEEEEETTTTTTTTAAAATTPPADAMEAAVAESYVVTKSALTSTSLPQLRQFASRHQGFAGWTAPPASASKTLVVARMLEHMTGHTWRRTGECGGGISAAKMSVVDAGMQFAIEAQRLRLFAGVDELIVENQIGVIAARMKSMQDVVMCMAVFAGVPKVRAVSAATKLAGFDGSDCPEEEEDNNNEPEEEEEERARKMAALARAKYQSRKAEGVARCRAWLAAHPVIARPWLAAFERTKKKDDMADSLLQLLGQLRIGGGGL